MPENNLPVPNSDAEAVPVEFDFTKPPEERPRVRKRSLKVKNSAALKPVEAVPAAARELEKEAPPLAASEVRPEYQPTSGYDKNDRKNAEVTMTEPSAVTAKTTRAAKPTVETTFTPPTPTNTKTTTSPHGTRPATLYYSSGTRKEKEETTPMKTTPSASPAPTSTTAPAVATTPVRTTPASGARTNPVVDYRSNVERQAREQKSVGSLLSIIVYALIALFVISAGLSGYGAKVIFDRLHDQSVTVSDLDQRLSAQNQALSNQLQTTMSNLAVAQGNISREQELILKQQETINKLISAAEDNAAAVRTERATRAEETSNIRARLRDLEYRGPTTQKY